MKEKWKDNIALKGWSLEDNSEMISLEFCVVPRGVSLNPCGKRESRVKSQSVLVTCAPSWPCFICCLQHLLERGWIRAGLSMCGASAPLLTLYPRWEDVRGVPPSDPCYARDGGAGAFSGQHLFLSVLEGNAKECLGHPSQNPPSLVAVDLPWPLNSLHKIQILNWTRICKNRSWFQDSGHQIKTNNRLRSIDFQKNKSCYMSFWIWIMGYKSFLPKVTPILPAPYPVSLVTENIIFTWCASHLSGINKSSASRRDDVAWGRRDEHKQIYQPK